MNQVFQSNDDLLQFMKSLSVLLKERGETAYANEMERVLSFNLGSASEFLGESKIILEHIKNACEAVLTQKEIYAIDVAVKQINTAFHEVGFFHSLMSIFKK